MTEIGSDMEVEIPLVLAQLNVLAASLGIYDGAWENVILWNEIKILYCFNFMDTVNTRCTYLSLANIEVFVNVKIVRYIFIDVLF